jgi:hypothetical protein
MRKISILVYSNHFGMPVSMPSADGASIKANLSSWSLVPIINFNNSCNVNGKIHLFHSISYSFSLTHHLDSHSDFLHGLSTSASNINQDPTTLKPAERLRLVYTYVTATPSDGGLGIHPDNDVWSRIESIMALHDPEYNDVWIRSVTTLASVTNFGHDQLDTIRTQVCFSTSNTCFPS